MRVRLKPDTTYEAGLAEAGPSTSPRYVVSGFSRTQYVPSGVDETGVCSPPHRIRPRLKENHMRTTRVICIAVVLVLAGMTPLLHGIGSWEVVFTGLDNPRGLAFGPEGALYIAEAGSGGAGPCAPGPQGIRCYGATGAITRYVPRTGSIERVVTGLPSLATNGAFATGPHHVSLQGRGNLFFTIGFGGDPRNREAQLGAVGRRFARLGRATPNGAWRLLE